MCVSFKLPLQHLWQESCLFQAQLLHCIEQAPGTGGANQFVDGFYVSQELRNKDPKKFDLLRKGRIQFGDVGKDVFGDYNQRFARKLIE